MFNLMQQIPPRRYLRQYLQSPYCQLDSQAFQVKSSLHVAPKLPKSYPNFSDSCPQCSLFRLFINYVCLCSNICSIQSNIDYRFMYLFVRSSSWQNMSDDDEGHEVTCTNDLKCHYIQLNSTPINIMSQFSPNLYLLNG